MTKGDLKCKTSGTVLELMTSFSLTYRLAQQVPHAHYLTAYPFICLSTLVEKCKSTHLKQQCSVRSNFLFILLAKTQQMAMASAQRLQPDPCYGRLHFRFHRDLTSSQGFSYHLFQTQISSSNLFPAIKCIIIRPPAHLCRHLNCDTSRMNSASSLFTFSLSLSLKPLLF